MNRQLIAVHPLIPSLAAWILEDGTRYISDECEGCYECEEGFDEMWEEIIEAFFEVDEANGGNLQ